MWSRSRGDVLLGPQLQRALSPPLVCRVLEEHRRRCGRGPYTLHKWRLHQCMDSSSPALVELLILTTKRPHHASVTIMALASEWERITGEPLPPEDKWALDGAFDCDE